MLKHTKAERVPNKLPIVINWASLELEQVHAGIRTGGVDLRTQNVGVAFNFRIF